MYREEIRFTVAGQETSDVQLLVTIPTKYAPQFEGHDFADMHELSMALMHASCAAEAEYYNRPGKVREHEGDLQSTLESRKADAVSRYSKARRRYLSDPSQANWKDFCDAKVLCRRLGAII